MMKIGCNEVIISMCMHTCKVMRPKVFK